MGFCSARIPESNSDNGNMLEKIFKKIRRRQVIKEFLKGYLKRLEMELVIEDYITQRILAGKTERRKELIEKQAEIKELRTFIDYLQGL